MTKIKVIIPAFNEQDSIAHVINDIPDIVEEVIAVSNNSTDNTEMNARNAEATVLTENQKGYGNACLKGMTHIANQETKPVIVVFCDGGYSDYPGGLTKLVGPIINNNIDFLICSRVKRLREVGSMTKPQIFGNWLATFLMKLMFGAKFTDLGPLGL